ncbi:unnamed protein product [Parnassius mnemosyne]|uniref:E3 ubiquitin-protein ligase RNF25 n=1 Tax=Parnassius mnemosyne TaxID=213953 RepID=A0AAV1KDR6_9NEOP
MTSVVDERVSDEVEVLEAILMNDVIIEREGNKPTIIETVVHPLTGDDTDQQYVCVTLEVKLTPDYPDSSPEVTLRNPRGLDDQLLSMINSQIKEKLAECLGQPVVFELIELVRENLTERNLPSGQCVICLYDFVEGDKFTKTQCYHYFHSHCLASHLIAGKKYYQEDLDKLPNWQQMQAPPYQPSCPVCRSEVSCNVDALKEAPPPIESNNAEPFRLTPEMKAMQKYMAGILDRQIAKGGVVGMGDTGPPPITITTPADTENEAATNGSPSSQQDEAKPEAIPNGRPAGNTSNENSTPGSPQAQQAYRGPYRGFNRRGKPGRRGRGAAGAR